jgi:hypothetical protein
LAPKKPAPAAARPPGVVAKPPPTSKPGDGQK